MSRGRVKTLEVVLTGEAWPGGAFLKRIMRAIEMIPGVKKVEVLSTVIRAGKDEDE